MQLKTFLLPLKNVEKRTICAASFEERVLHHALMNVCGPVFERVCIDDTFACREGRGQSAAIRRAQGFACRWDWFLKMDVRKYFDSVHQATLLDMIGSRFKDPAILELSGRIVRSYYTGSNRVIRGGSWNNPGNNCRSAQRNNNDPGNRNNNIGFRAVLAPAQSFPRWDLLTRLPSRPGQVSGQRPRRAVRCEYRTEVRGKLRAALFAWGAA